jgi:hypothetical protein
LTAAVLQLGVRGAQRVRVDVPMWDFVSVYAAARSWIRGGDPYDLPCVVSTWRDSGIFAGRDVSYFATVYPPTTLLVLAPLAMLPAGAAMILWLALTLGLLVLQFGALAAMAKLPRRDSRMLLLIAGSLAAAPLQFGILSGQLSLPAISLCILPFWCVSCGRRERLAGALLGVACALKPQLGAPFALYYLVFGPRPTGRMAVLVGLALCDAALLAMRFSHVDWIGGWTHSIALTTRPGGVNDYGFAAAFRDEIVDLKMLLVGVVGDPLMLRLIVSCVVLVLGGLFARFHLRSDRRDGPGQLLALAALSAISLLPVYHRVYDAALLTMALAWAVLELDGTRRRSAIALLVPLTVFLIPFDALGSVARHVPVLLAVSRSGWWQMLIAPHYAWGLVAVAITAIWIIGRQPRSLEQRITRSATPASGSDPALEPAQVIRQS